MPLELPTGWVSIPAPRGLNLVRKWEAVKDARLPTDLSAASEAEAHAEAEALVEYCAERTDADSWLAPCDTVGLGRGDCEDWCLVARALLINGGFDSASLWLLVVKDLICRQDHALLWTPSCYLDCRANRPIPHSVFSEFRPIIGFADDEAVAFGRRR